MRILFLAVLLLAGCATRDDQDFEHSQAELEAMARRIKAIHDQQTKY